ncbi:MAG TPA: site-specific DNA-methyltransferase [Frankiaceae bacterium]|nr:site-specific DNA-methyltransferase [Frankiaceae bacterium]
MPPRSRKPTGPTPVESLKHDDKRVNLPTADAADAYDYTPEVGQVTYPRDPTLDPQLVWRGKDEQNTTDLVADAPPIYIQEKIDPRVLIENLRHTAKPGEPEPEILMFEGFDGLDELQAVEFYEHDADWSNRMILGDSLQVMASLAELENLRGQVQMIYVDPPYGIKFGSNWQASARRRDVKDGNLVDAAREAEQIKAFRDTWELGIHSYLSYLRDRLMAARDLLTESGSVFVQIGDENVHLVRSLLDEVFGSENFVSQIIFRKTSGATSRYLPPTADHIIWFAKAFDSMKYREPLRMRRGPGDADSAYSFVELPDGTRRRLTPGEIQGAVELQAGSRVYRQQILTSPRIRAGRSGYYAVEVDGKSFLPTTGEWKTHPDGMRRLVAAGRVIATGRSLSYVRYLDDFPALVVTNLWDDTQSGSGMDKIYVVQSSSKVVERCMLMCTDPGDLVLDPTCGSGTTAYVAEQWGRRWITIDTSRVALALARQRLMGARFPYYLKADSPEGRAKEQEITGRPLPPVPTTGDIKQGFVYERVQHITLKSIANNPDIVEGMSREAIDAAVKRHTDFEVLYDRPYEERNTVRVAGRFTVESLSPHRSLTFDQRAAEANRESIGEQLAAQEATGPTFEQSILDNLAKAGIQNGKRNERITFATVDAYPGQYLQAIGEPVPEVDGDVRQRVGIAIGPQYGTVSPAFIKAAAREAIKARDVDLVAVLGFAFDAQATEATEEDGVTITPSDEGFASVAGERKLGRIPVLLVRMNVDLLMGEDLKKSGSGNLFTVFGEPDIELRDAPDGRVVVEIKGVDVYDPTTGEVRSNDTGLIALWMIDTNYNEESFFVRHCYFTGGNDPYKRLKTALNADIDAEAWETLYRTESRPFDRPETGKIAVKVINDYGDEVMRVFAVAR